MMFSFQSGQLGHSANTIILKSNEHKSYALVFGVICTFQSSQFFERLSMHFGVVDHIRASALTTADRRPPSWNGITDSIVLVPILTRTRNDAPRCIRVLIKNRKTYDLRGLMFLHIDVSVRCCILQHVEITNKQG
jgi:hypothetical protein